MENSLNDISKIEIEGGVFKSPEVLNVLCWEKTDKDGSTGIYKANAAVIYGRNGSGKSTISKSFLKLKGEAVEHVKSVKLLDMDGNQINLSKAELDKIKVFNEDFIDKNIKIDEAGFEAVLMISETVIDNASKIDELSSKIKALETENEKYENAIFEYESSNLSEKKKPNNMPAIVDRMKDKIRNTKDSFNSRCIKALADSANTKKRSKVMFMRMEPMQRFISTIRIVLMKSGNCVSYWIKKPKNTKQLKRELPR